MEFDMTKKKVEKASGEEVEQEQEEEVKEVETKTEPDAVQSKAAEIELLFSDFSELYGIQFDAQNPDHRVVAAWLIGRTGTLRK
jgi:hypothetical protein